MPRQTLAFLCLFMTLNMTLKGQDWRTISVIDSLTIHKLTAFEGEFWGVDYGNGLILNSPNGTDNWKVLADLPSEYLERIQFLDHNLGFTCGDYGYVYKTTDGGKNWIEISPSVDLRITEAYRGDSTKNQEPDGMFVAYYDMFFASETQGFVWGFKYNPSKGFRESFERLIFETNDGGNSWSPVPSSGYEALKSTYYSNLPKDKTHLSGTFYLDKNHLWKSENIDRKQHISRSIDAGQTWESSRLPDEELGRYIIRSIIFKNTREGYVYAGTLGDEPLKAVVFQTTDGGKTWSLPNKDWPHLHDAIWAQGRIWVTGKNGFLQSGNMD